MKINRWQIGRRAITCPLATLITSQNRDILRFPTAINHLNMPLNFFHDFRGATCVKGPTGRIEVKPCGIPRGSTQDADDR